MSTSKHTPGPWIEYPQGIIRQDTANHKDGQSIAVIVPLTKVHILEAEKSNAALIAAAPDLLATLEVIANQCGDYATDSPALDYASISNLARAAIAKAKGE